jgi:hypothetical protein
MGGGTVRNRAVIRLDSYKVLLAFAIIIALALGSVGYRKAYGAWWPQPPDHFSYCGRFYETNHSLVLSRAGVTKAESKTGLPGEGPYPVVTVGRVPPVIGRPLLAAVTPDASRQKFDPPLPCAMGLFLKTGADEYTGYFLLGGP